MKKKMDSLSAKTPPPTTAVPVVEEVQPHPAATPTVTPEVKPAETPSAASSTPEKAPEPAPAAEPTPATPSATPATIATSEPQKDSFEELFPEPRVALGAPPTWLWWVLLLVVSIVLGIVGYALTRHNLKDWLSTNPTPSPSATAIVTATATPEPTATATPDPTPTATPTTVDNTKVTLRVLNGTTTSGAASKAATILEKSNFKVRTTGNAKTQDYKATIIYYTVGNQAEAEAVQAGLTGYTATLQESTLASPDMVLVIIGKS
jgi:hypothetical protein